MNKRKRIPVVSSAGIVCCAVALAFVSCSLKVAGSVTEGGNVEVAGTVVNSGGQGISGVVVEIRLSTFLKDTSGSAPSRRVSTNTISDDSGHFLLDSIDPGDYCITATSGETLAVLLKVSLEPGKTTLPPSQILPAAQISGTVLNKGSASPSAFVRLYGLDRLARVNAATGSYAIAALPQGVFRLQVDVTSSEYKPVVIPEIPCATGQVTTVDTIAVAPFFGENYSTWLYKTSVKLNTTASGAQVASTQIGFPIVVHLSANTAFPFGQCQADGRDLRFANSQGKHLPFEIERFDPSGQIADIWVLVDTIKGNDTTAITMYWGNSNAVAQLLSPSVFDTALGYMAVWHFNDRALNDRKDATYNGYNAVPAPGTYEGDEWTYGLIGGCDSLDDNDDHLNAPDINAGKKITLSMWVNLYEASISGRQYFLGKPGDVAGRLPLYSLMLNNSKQLTMYITAQGKPDSVSGGDISVFNAWYFVTGTYDGATLKIYLNGSLVNSKAVTGQIDSSGADLTLGWYDVGTEKTLGKIDECRIMKTAQSADWIKLNYENQKANGAFITFGN